MKDYDVLVVGERAAVMVDQQSPAARRRSRTRLVVQVVLSLMLVVAIVYFMVNATGLAQAAIRSHNFARYGRRRVAKTQSRTAVSPPSLTRTCSDRGVHVGLTAAMEYDNEEHITWGSTIADELRKRRSAGRAPVAWLAIELGLVASARTRACVRLRHSYSTAPPASSDAQPATSQLGRFADVALGLGGL